MKKKFTFLMAAMVLLTMMVLPGKAVGQNYTYVVASSIEAGDVVVLVNAAVDKELNGISTTSTKYGLGANVTNSLPAGLYPLTVENGYSDGSFAFKNSNNQYLYHSGANSNHLNVNTTLDNKTSWTVSINANDKNATIANKNATSRIIRWNSDRFACYTTNTGTLVKIYKRVEAKVATPTFSPAAGNYASAQNVTISTATDGATIHYTTDGTNPTTSSPTYSTAISVTSGTMTIKALAVKNGLTNSDIATAVYTIVTPRELHINSDFGDVTVTVNSEEVELTSGYYSIPEGATVNLSVTPDADHAFNGWTVNSDGVTIDNNSFEMPSKNVELTAEYIATTTHAYDFSDINNFYTATIGDTHPTPSSVINEFYYGTNRDKFTADGSDKCQFTLYSNSYYFIFGKSGAYIKLPTFMGYKIIKVVLHSSSGCSQNVGVQIVDNNGTTVSETQTWSDQNSDYTYDIPTSYQKSDLTVKIATNHNAQITSISIVCVELPSYTLTIGSHEHGSITVKDKNNDPISDGASVKEGALVKLEATPNEDYALSAFTVTKAGSGSVEVTTDGNNGTFNMPDDAVTVNATFAPKKTLTYDKNGGTGTNVVEDYATGSVVTLRDGAIFTAPEHYYFTNWNEKSDGSGTPHAAGSDFTINANTTLFAQWSNLYNVAVSAVEYAVVSASYGSNNTIAAGENANVAYGTTITLNHNLGSDKTVVWNVTAGDDPVAVENNAFTVPAANVIVAGEVKDIYTVTFNINGDVSTIAPVNVIDGNSIDLTDAAYQASMTGYTFVGWSTTQGSSTTIASPATYTPDETITLYAVFKKVSGEGTVTITTTGMPTQYPSGTSYILDGQSFYLSGVANYTGIQFRASNGVLYNTANFGRITEIKLTYTTYRALTVKASENESGDHGNAVSSNETEGNVRTYDLSDSNNNYHFFIIKNTTSNAAKLSEIKITYESSSTVVFISSACTIENIAEDEIVTVSNGGILTFTGDNNGNASNLVIEDGGQLIVSNEGVQATFQKSVTGFGSLSKEDENPYNDNYKLIAKPTVDDETNVLPANIGNMLTTDPNNYDLYYFDENKNGAEWRNYKVGDGFTINNGKGYLYANSNTITLNFAGEVPTATTESGIALDYTAGTHFAGFNLVGNPFAVNITSMNNNDKTCGYYKLNDDGTFTPTTASATPIAVGQGFMVEASAENKSLNLNLGDGEDKGFSNESIRLEVANSEYTDVAYICFGNMMPLTKINHMNEEAPMIYIHNEKSDKAVAVYNNRGEVKSFNVNFVAKTTGRYTISGKMMNGEVKYMHLYDRLTGVDTDLLADSYTFIGAKGDNAGRFILNLESVDNGSSTGSETFAWQSGSEIIVDGEGTLEVYDVTGRKVMNAVVNGAHKVSGLNNGLYIFKLNGKTQKIIVR